MSAMRDANGVSCTTRKTVLIAEDNADLLNLFAMAVSMEGCNVAKATDGAEAVEQAALCEPDLIFMDIAMPGMDGLEATRQILSVPRLSRIPVIAISAHGSKDWERRAHAAGCVEWVNKQLDQDQFHDIIERYIGSC